jgi:hypothetical protein
MISNVIRNNIGVVEIWLCMGTSHIILGNETHMESSFVKTKSLVSCQTDCIWREYTQRDVLVKQQEKNRDITHTLRQSSFYFSYSPIRFSSFLTNDRPFGLLSGEMKHKTKTSNEIRSRKTEKNLKNDFKERKKENRKNRKKSKKWFQRKKERK